MDSLAQYRLNNAVEKLESAKLLLDAGKYKDSIGRSYYAIFSAVRAVLAGDYDDFFIASKQDADEQYQKACEFIQVIRRYLEG